VNRGGGRERESAKAALQGRARLGVPSLEARRHDVLVTLHREIREVLEGLLYARDRLLEALSGTASCALVPAARWQVPLLLRLTLVLAYALGGAACTRCGIGATYFRGMEAIGPAFAVVHTERHSCSGKQHRNDEEPHYRRSSCLGEHSGGCLCLCFWVVAADQCEQVQRGGATSERESDRPRPSSLQMEILVVLGELGLVYSKPLHEPTETSIIG